MKLNLPVLLLHGWGGSARSAFVAHGWSDALAEIDRHVLLEDLPGHGLAPASVDPHDYADLAAEISRRLPEGQIDVIGYSLGAKLALKLAADQPRQFRRIVAIGVGDNAFAPEKSAETVASALELGLTDASPPPVRSLVEYSRASASNPKALAAVLRRPPNPVLQRDALRPIGARTLLINSAEDHIAQPDSGLRAALPGLTHVLLNGVTHIGLIADVSVRHTAVRFLDLVDEREAPSTEMRPDHVDGH